MVCSMMICPEMPPAIRASMTSPSARAKIGVPSGAAQSLPSWKLGTPVIGSILGPNLEVWT